MQDNSKRMHIVDEDLYFVLFTAAVGSFFAGTVTTFLIAGFAPPLAEVALTFGAPEYFALLVLGLAAAVTLAHGSILKALAMIVLGLLLGTMGRTHRRAALHFRIDRICGWHRLYGACDGRIRHRRNHSQSRGSEMREPIRSRLRDLIPTRQELAQIVMPVLRGTGLGSILGILPGGGAVLGSFASYSR